MLISPPRSQHRAVAVIALYAMGCLDPGGTSLAIGGSPDASDAARSPDVLRAPCAQDGAGTLRVAVSLSPSLANEPADVWLAVHCNDNPAPVRLVRWDGSASQTLEGFGPGTYRVLGTSLRAPGHWSTTALLSGVSTAAVSLTLGGDGVPIATLTSTGDVSAGDAGTRDATVALDAVDDAGFPRAEWQARVPLRDPAGQTLGSFVVAVRAAGDGFLDVSASAQNLCATSLCAPLPLVGLEARALEGEAPLGAAITTFEQPLAPYGEVIRALPLRLRGRLPDARSVLQFAVYAAIPSASRGVSPSARP